MNNEILEISQWLYEKGFECDWWEMDGVLYPEQEAEYEICNPYFTLNRALELLPDEIESEDRSCQILRFNGQLGFSKSKKSFLLGYFFEYRINGKEIERWEKVTECEDYHLAALRLLKKTVEEDYVKAN